MAFLTTLLAGRLGVPLFIAALVALGVLGFGNWNTGRRMAALEASKAAVQEKLDKANADLLVERANVSTLKGTIESNARVAEANRRAGEALSAAMAGSVKAIDAQSTASARQTAELAKRLAAAGKNASNTESVVTEDVWARL